MERQISEATRIALRKNCLNSKAGFNRSGVTRLTLKPEEIQATVRVIRREDNPDKEGLELMRIRAEQRGQAEKDKSKKRGPGAEEENDKNTNKRASKKPRKLRYGRIEEDWGMQDSGIQEMEERGIVRTRFLLSDRKWAEVGSKQTRIRVWSELEVLARMIITDCIYQVIKETEETEFKTRRVDNSNWLETEEAGVEFDIVPEG